MNEARRFSDATFETTSHSGSTPQDSCVGLVILFHPVLERIAGTAALFDGGKSGARSVGRNEPSFRSPDGTLAGPLETRRVSRHCLHIRQAAGGALTLDPGDAEVYVRGALLSAPLLLEPEDVQRGLPIGLGKHVVLWLGRIATGNISTGAHGLVGLGADVARVRSEIEQVADLDVPVLLRGETGTGKELVAAAIHRAGPRASGPLISVNMAAIPPSTAASELFGHRRGSFTGAASDRSGCFRDAQNGTLFLDEIGDTPGDIQPMLLRAIEAGEIQPVGSTPLKVNVRVLAATDSNLEVAIQSGQFRSPLLRRFGYSIHLPALRARREDLGLLFRHFVSDELVMLETRGRRVARDDANPWLPAGFALRLVEHDWPGNVRELRNVVRRLVIRRSGAGAPPLTLAELGLSEPGAPRVQPGNGPPASLDDITDERLIAVWGASGFDVERARQSLGVGRTWLLQRLDRCEGVVRGKDLTASAIEEALAQCGHDPDQAARTLKVSRRALLLRLRALGRSSTRPRAR